MWKVSLAVEIKPHLLELSARQVEKSGRAGRVSVCICMWCAYIRVCVLCSAFMFVETKMLRSG